LEWARSFTFVNIRAQEVWKSHPALVVNAAPLWGQVLGPASLYRGLNMTGNRQGRLLLVEDEARLRDLVSLFLRMERYEVIEADDGVRGVERHVDSGPFDLVIVDLDLPRLPGVEVCRRIKQSRPDQRVLVCSAAILDQHLLALDELGVDRILTKPYLPARLLGEVAWAMSIRSIPEAGNETAKFSSNDARWCATSAHSQARTPHSLVNSPRTK